MLVMAVFYLASLAALSFVGLRPAVPWGFTLLLPVLFVPFALIFLFYSRHQMHPALDTAAAVVILVAYQHFMIWPILAIGLLLSRSVEKIQYQWRLIRDGVVTTVLGYAALWNLNYLLARLVPTVHDSSLRASDEWIYSWFFSSVSYKDFFPILHDAFLVQVLNSAYMVLFPEVSLVLLLVCQTGEAGRVTRFLKGLFAFYTIGVMCFLIYPAIGPCLYYPDSLDPKQANLLVEGMLHDYHAAISGGTLKGYGYFIALPSLHVMVALYLQRCLVSFAGLYRVFLPVNVMLILSTVVLGYHYVIDALFAVLIMGIWMMLQKRFTI